jgi:hypothetical protein
VLYFSIQCWVNRQPPLPDLRLILSFLIYAYFSNKLRCPVPGGGRVSCKKNCSNANHML